MHMDKKDKKKAVLDLEKEPLVDDTTYEVATGCLLLEDLVPTEGGFWPLWRLGSPKLNVKHKHHELPLEWEFWGALMCHHDKGWLQSEVTLKLLLHALCFYRY